MEIYWALIGIVISIALSLPIYRQTVGARRERIRAANSELEKVLTRRIVLESYQPTVDDLSRLISGKALEHNVSRGDLVSETQLLETVFTRITESDFMIPDRRNEVLDRLSPVFTRAEKAAEEKVSLALMPIEVYRRERRITPAFTIGLSASLFGAMVTAIAALFIYEGTFTSRSIVYIIAAFVCSITVILAIFRLFILRESREEPSARSAIQLARDFEQEVISTLTKLKIPVFIAERTSGFDLITTLGEKKILIEVKALSRRPPVSILRNTIDRLNRAVQTKNADEGIIVTKSSFELPHDFLKNTKIRIMTLREFRNYMVHY